jgi:phospholipid-translocating ATPase
MVFKKCSIGGKVYNGDEVPEGEEEKGASNGVSKDFPPAYVKEVTSANEKGVGTDIPLENVISSPSSTNGDSQQPSNAKNVATDSSKLDDNRPSSSSESSAKVHFHDAELTQDIFSAVHADQDSTDADHARHLNGFFSVLALCHTVLTSVDKETGNIEYKAQSPDEAALVQAAADMGFVFKGREREVLLLQTPFGGTNVGGPEDEDEIIHREPGYPSSSTGGEDSLERYELLNILEFTSARKRMSVVLRKLDGDDSRLFLLSKGADSVIFERLKPGAGDDLKEVTEKHLDEFASQGLRTLTLAYKVIKGMNFVSVNCGLLEGLNFPFQRTNIMHGVNDIKKLRLPWMTARQKLMRYLTNLSKIYDYSGLRQ